MEEFARGIREWQETKRKGCNEEPLFSLSLPAKAIKLGQPGIPHTMSESP